MRLNRWWFLLGAWGALMTLAACSDDLYAACDSVDDCELPEGTDGVCLDKSSDGFCTWRCDTDDDCEDDLDEEYDYVCASFENQPDKYCFPGCNGEACPAGLGCRSTGGGNQNRKVCFPGEGDDGPPG